MDTTVTSEHTAWENMLTDFSLTWDNPLPLPEDALISLFKERKLTISMMLTLIDGGALSRTVVDYLIDDDHYNRWLVFSDDLTSDDCKRLLWKDIPTLATLLKKNILSREQLEKYLDATHNLMVFNTLYLIGAFEGYPAEWLEMMYGFAIPERPTAR